MSDLPLTNSEIAALRADLDAVAQATAQALRTLTERIEAIKATDSKIITTIQMHQDVLKIHGDRLNASNAVIQTLVDTTVAAGLRLKANLFADALKTADARAAKAKLKAQDKELEGAGAPVPPKKQKPVDPVLQAILDGTNVRQDSPEPFYPFLLSIPPQTEDPAADYISLQGHLEDCVERTLDGMLISYEQAGMLFKLVRNELSGEERKAVPLPNESLSEIAASIMTGTPFDPANLKFTSKDDCYLFAFLLCNALLGEAALRLIRYRNANPDSNTASH